MITKLFEVRDVDTFIPCIATAVGQGDSGTESERYLLGRTGYGSTGPRCVLFGTLLGTQFHYVSFNRTEFTRTLRVAHKYIEEHWDDLQSGAVIDVEFILGETDQCKQSESKEFV